jgi:hypothetical protein
MKTTTTKPKPEAAPKPDDCRRSHAPDCSELAKLIPFTMTMHMSGDRWNSGRYTNKRLKIGHEYHSPVPKNPFGKTKRKVKRWFYREVPRDAPCYATLAELLEADTELRQRAIKIYSPNTQPHGHATDGH